MLEFESERERRGAESERIRESSLRLQQSKEHERKQGT